MAAEKAMAIVVRVVDFSESSCIVTLFSREVGKISGLAKGGRRLKGPFEGALDLLSQVRVVFLRKSSDALDLLTEAKLDSRFRPRDGSLDSLYSAYYIAELLDRLTDQYDPHPDLFDLAAESLAALATTGPIGSILLHFELNTLRILGYLPSLDQCVECGSPVPSAGRVPFGLLAGGVLCRDCRPGKKHVVSVTGKVLETIRAYADAEHVEWQIQPIDKPIQGELRAVLNQYLAHLLGRAPRMQAYLGAAPA